MPYDLSDGSGANRPISIDQPGAPVTTGRASDLLRSPSAPVGGPRAGRDSPLLSQRPATPLDSLATSLFYLALIAVILSFSYLMYGVWLGSLANPHFNQGYTHADHVRVLNALTMAANVFRIGSLVAIATVVFLYYDEEALGYLLILTAVFLYAGVPFLSQFFMGMQHGLKPSVATTLAIDSTSGVFAFPAVPGVVLIVWDLIRRAITGMEQAKIRRAGMRYGQNAAVQIKRRNQFLGPCWNLPYCREAIRARCPIQIKHRGPCWRYKQGCMCDQSIALLATSAGDWKDAVSKAMDSLESKGAQNKPKGGNPLLGFSDVSGRPQLSWAEKKQRCRECLIYNTHQEQKYKALTVAVFVGLGATVYFGNSLLIGLLGGLFDRLNSGLGQFSLAAHGGAPVVNGSASEPVAWFSLIVLTLLVLSKLLQLVEYVCFTLKA